MASCRRIASEKTVKLSSRRAMYMEMCDKTAVDMNVLIILIVLRIPIILITHYTDNNIE